EGRQHRPHPLGLLGRLLPEAAGLAGVRVVADVLVGPARQPQSQEELVVVALRHREGADGVVHDLAALQALLQGRSRTPRARRRNGRDGGSRHADGLLLLFVPAIPAAFRARGAGCSGETAPRGSAAPRPPPPPERQWLVAVGAYTDG